MIFTETEHLVLRNVEPKDVETIFDYRNNELCARYQRGQTKDLSGIRELIQKRRGDRLSIDAPALLAVALKETGEIVGEIVVMPNDGTICLGYTISYKHHRKGIAYEALSALIALLHERYPDWEFICFTDPRNIASMELLKKLGYRDMGYLPHRDSQIFGKWTTAETDAEIARIARQ